MASVPGIARGMGIWVPMRPVSTPEHSVPALMQCERCKAMADPHTMWRAAISTHHNRAAVNTALRMYLHCNACMLITEPTQAWVDADANAH